MCLKSLYFVPSNSCWIFSNLLLMIAVHVVMKIVFLNTSSFDVSRINNIAV